jgi:hypothetical protein
MKNKKSIYIISIIVLTIVYFFVLVYPFSNSSSGSSLGRLIGYFLTAFIISSIVSSKSKKNNEVIKGKGLKVFTIAYCIFLILAIFLGISEKNTPKQNFKEVMVDKSSENSEIVGSLYKNNKYNFSIEFPDVWEIGDSDIPDTIKQATYEGDTISVQLKQMDFDNNKFNSIKDVGSLEDVTNSLIQGAKSQFETKIIDRGETQINNNPAYWVEYSIAYSNSDYVIDMTSITYVLAKGNIMYSISAGATTSKFNELVPTLNKSINSFLLLN